ncbi:MAG TPA: hypothetical protein VK272_03915 [Solirubrobacteraceae bacterium]|nr:hypothetical protein [Solirubrobacteraceae bacterium]
MSEQHNPSTQAESELVELLRSIDVRAPQELHRRIEAMVGERAPARRRRPPAIRWGLSGAAALAALVLVLVLSLAGGGGSVLTLRSAVALTLSPATMVAPAENPRDGMQVTASADGIPFPYWGESFGWRSTGERTDRVDGRAVTTVFYGGADGQSIGYAIVSGTPAPRVGGGIVEQRDGISYRVQMQDGAQVVTWLRDGRLCVLAGHGVSAGTLLALASWRGDGTLGA